MLDRPDHDNRLTQLQQQIEVANSSTCELMSDVIAQCCTGFIARSPASRASRIRQLIETEAWTDAVLALIDLELPQYKLRRLVREDGLWHCSLSKQPGLPIGLDETAEASHEILPLAILYAFLEARRDLAASAAPLPQVRPAQELAVCCDSFA